MGENERLGEELFESKWVAIEKRFLTVAVLGDNAL